MSGCAGTPTGSTRPRRCASSAAGTDLRLSLAGRTGEVDEGHTNMPGGEFFYSPLEDSAEGVIEFSEFPAGYQGHEFSGIRLVFRDGAVVDASATKNEETLHEMLDRDEGARRIGELGIGCNPALTRPMNHVLFDEKMDGTDPPGARAELREGRREERELDPLGHRQGPARGWPDRARRRAGARERPLADLTGSASSPARSFRRARRRRCSTARCDGTGS